MFIAKSGLAKDRQSLIIVLIQLGNVEDHGQIAGRTVRLQNTRTGTPGLALYRPSNKKVTRLTSAVRLPTAKIHNMNFPGSASQSASGLMVA